MTDFPDATNTGVTGAAMTVYDGPYYVTQDNANVSNLVSFASRLTLR